MKQLFHFEKHENHEIKFEVIKTLHKTERNTVYVANYKHIDVPIVIKKSLIDKENRCLKVHHHLVPKDYFFFHLLKKTKITPHLYDYREWNDHSYLCMEYLDEDWCSYLTLINENIDVNAIKMLMRRIIKDLIKMESFGAYYVNLKPDNILVNRKTNEIVFIDFEDAHYSNNKHETINLSMGTMGFCSPEMCYKVPYRPDRSIVFSVGCLLYASLAKHVPFEDAPATKAVRYDKQYIIDHFGSRIIDLLDMCLALDPACRITLHQILDFDWMKISKTRRSILKFFTK